MPGVAFRLLFRQDLFTTNRNTLTGHVICHRIEGPDFCIWPRNVTFNGDLRHSVCKVTVSSLLLYRVQGENAIYYTKRVECIEIIIVISLDIQNLRVFLVMNLWPDYTYSSNQSGALRPHSITSLFGYICRAYIGRLQPGDNSSVLVIRFALCHVTLNEWVWSNSPIHSKDPELHCLPCLPCLLSYLVYIVSFP